MNRIQKISFSAKIWKPLPEIPKDPIFTFNMMYAKDKNPKKVNLSVGAYADENGKPWILPSVKMALAKITSDSNFNCSYLPMNGDPEFLEECVKLAYGFDPTTGNLANNVSLNRIARTQTLSGTGGLFTAMNFVKNQYEYFNNDIYIPNTSWPIHRTMAKLLGYNTQSFHYYDVENRKFNFDDYYNSLKNIPNKAFIILHCSGQNPTGFDPSAEEWRKIADLILQKEFFVLMDNAYQGFVSGDIEVDGYPIRLFAEKGIKMLVCQSFAKNIGLYGQRTGCLSMIMDSEEEATKVSSYFGYRNRNQFSNPPRFGSDIAKIVLKDQVINQQWRKDIKTMSGSIANRRQLFVDQMEKYNLKQKWEYLLKQKGMFAFTHLKVPVIQALRENYAIYMTEDGRMSITGMNANNIAYIAEAISKVDK